MSAAETLDLDVLSQALELPTFKIGGTRYTGKLMGWSDFNHWTHALDKLTADPGADDLAIEAVIRGVLGAMQFDEEAQRALLAAPRPLGQKTLTHFFGLHRVVSPPTAPPAPVTP